MDEFSLLKTHPAVGRKLLEDHPLGPLVPDVITYHHERCDGQGYPFGIRSQSLSIYPRIIAVADCFDAMTSTRSYRKGIYRLHIAQDTFELEPTGQQRFDLQPEIDLEQINDLASGAPRRIAVNEN